LHKHIYNKWLWPALSLGLEPDIFTLQANNLTTVILTVNDKLVNLSIHF